MDLFTELNELTEQEIQSKLQVSESILGSNGKWTLGNEVSSLSKHQSTRISQGIEKFISEKQDIRNKSELEVRNSLGLLIEYFGDISLGKFTREMSSNFKDDIRKLSKNRKKLKQYRDLDFHTIVKMNIDEKDRMSTVTVNNHLSYISSFFKWSVVHGFVHRT